MCPFTPAKTKTKKPLGTETRWRLSLSPLAFQLGQQLLGFHAECHSRNASSGKPVNDSRTENQPSGRKVTNGVNYRTTALCLRCCAFQHYGTHGFNRRCCHNKHCEAAAGTASLALSPAKCIKQMQPGFVATGGVSTEHKLETWMCLV